MRHPLTMLLKLPVVCMPKEIGARSHSVAFSAAQVKLMGPCPGRTTAAWISLALRTALASFAR